MALSSKFGVSKSLDSFIIFPDRLLGISAVDAKNGLLKNPWNAPSSGENCNSVFWGRCMRPWFGGGWGWHWQGLWKLASVDRWLLVDVRQRPILPLTAWLDSLGGSHWIPPFLLLERVEFNTFRNPPSWPTNKVGNCYISLVSQVFCVCARFRHCGVCVCWGPTTVWILNFSGFKKPLVFHSATGRSFQVFRLKRKRRTDRRNNRPKGKYIYTKR